MRIFTYVVTTAAFALLGISNAVADAEPGQGYFSIMGSYIDDDKDRDVEDDFNGGQLGFGYAVSDALNIEAFFSGSWADGEVFNDQEILGLGIDLQRVFRRAERFSPYLHAGVGYMTLDAAGEPEDEGAMYSAGAGFLLDLFDSNAALRGEWRHRMDAVGTNNLNDNLFSLGVQIPFGPGTPKFVDTDGDGVADGMDRCPNTPAGTRVDAYGCEVDSDGDGVKDSMDKCPGTPKGVAVNASGCAKDSDGDGVSDGKDKCPKTPKGAKVDANGCELDGDKDGVVDRLDECPNSAPGVQVDIKGCEIKAVIRLPGVNFQSNSDRLLPGATSVLNDAVATLKKNPTITFEVAGHTDSDGPAEYNEGLSSRRAQTVHDYLASNGIAEDRMSVRGYGESQPIADNGTREGKAQNRRVVLRVIER
ncbi:MAG: OmpA family protein [Gammaproteobacteria bacterium]|nr:OmpA family protein [Gammaproteobacteria bacterium]NNC56482.1 OmpA family protein [Woeseiaceae bacterium]NNL51608.1 OmpA family protein [Woeseiaceae bacterium]